MTKLLPVLLALSVLAALVAAPDDPPRGKGGGKGGGGKGGGGKGGGAGVEPAVVPPYLFNVWLCRPEAESITASIIAWEPLEAFITYGEDGSQLKQRTDTVKIDAGETQSVMLSKLKPDTSYTYQLTYRRNGGEPATDILRNFHTQRKAGSTFTFVTQADSHLDTNTDVRVYQQTLANMLADKPDFMVDLGDTTMVDKFGSFYTRAESQYQAQRYHIGRIAHSVPIFLALGNHDGEKAERLTGKQGSMPLWSLGMRKKFFPNPEPGGSYTGNSTPFENAGLLQNYFAWEWGNALFIVLDPFWATSKRTSEDNWSMTLGEAQYRWLTKTLETSRAPFKLVFLHHLVGGIGRDVRGGVAAAPYGEWGGKNSDGSEGFARQRPGWALPIHQLLVKHGTSIMFHGHDHLFVKEELDGIIYQEVPQPCHASGGTRSAEEYGYTGVILGSSGHMRITVSPSEAKVDYVRSIVPGVTRDSIDNGTVEHSYMIKKK
ncbi:MAG: metallophosphoesterase [Verrucomicrobiaceae bacterium]|nr:metallophosphoesterase [Verrucomicrobiaceae bacterium]